MTTKLPKGIRLRSGKYYWSKQIEGHRFYGSEKDLVSAITAMDKADEQEEHPKITLLDAINQILENMEGTTAITTQKCAASRYKKLLTYFSKDTLLRNITTKDIDVFIKQLVTEKHPASYINIMLMSLSKLYTVGKDYGWIENKPVFHWVKNPNRKIRFLTVEEEHQLLSQLDQPYKDVITILIDTGMRVRELLSVTKENVDIPNKKITLWKTKTNSTRTIPMTDRVCQLIQARMPELFSHVKYVTLQYHFNCARKAIHLENDDSFTIHTCRHTCASRLIQHGVAVPVIQRWLGHSNISTTMRYAHLTDDALKGAVNILNHIH